jgi:hypothetical protein
VPQSRTGRRVGGRTVKLCHITTLVRVGRPRVLPASVFAWRGELAPYTSLRRSPGFKMAPHSCGPRSPHSYLRVRASPQSETKTTRANEQVVGGEAETCHAKSPSVRYLSEARRLASEGLDKDLQPSLCWILTFTLSMVSEDSTWRVIISPFKGA